MRFMCRRQPIPGARNRPTLAGARVEVPDYAEAIARGFTSVYRLLVEHREELLADGGPLARFARDEVRVILRPTSTYASLLSESFHPDLLRDALERDRWFDRLWVAVEHRPSLARVIAAERDDLLNGDIPLFTTRPASRDVWSSTGAPIADYLEETGLSLAPPARSSSASATSSGNSGSSSPRWRRCRRRGAVLDPSPRQEEPAAGADRGRLLAAARAVGDRLEVLRCTTSRCLPAFGRDLSPRGHWTLMPMGVDLYGGLAGQALFLAYLGTVTEETRGYTSLARGADGPATPGGAGPVLRPIDRRLRRMGRDHLHADAPGASCGANRRCWPRPRRSSASSPT